ncbi:MAG: HD domain-containing protein [Sulfuricurvum sp.]|jgi:tRNA nucleotidyltransferase (CCA-adding enzyme)|uniref:CCA tRNA nucleotidyltransferase n=1 Tax=Sulfuricurvum sp. TaxID=2025608 RepID=UPI0025D17B80|nr:HD domain-containing protein [Sulfuricurvum sp.]MCK9371968.1 HD domain-containing protein [Sulfuricurvum sp.]
MISVPLPILPIIETLSRHRITPILVGGYVRDALIGHTGTDLDFELYGVTSLDELERILKPFGKLNAVGKSFGVLKLSYQGFSIDFSPPRTESKQASGHKGFEIAFMRGTDFTAAARRRDFTINAIGYNPLDKTLLDPFGGRGDLSKKRLACVNPETFIEDPLRLLRAVQFAARFDLKCDEKLLSLCRIMIEKGALQELPKERIFEEFKKLLLSPKPSVGLSLLKAMGGLSFFSPLEKLETTLQDPGSHPEGDVWTHTLMCVDEMARLRTGDSKRDTVLMFAALLHDIAKPVTTFICDGKINAPRHAEEGALIAEIWLSRITEEKSLIEAVLPLVRHHGTPRKFYQNHSPDTEILRLSTKVAIADLILVARADYFGRSLPSVPDDFKAGKWLYERAQALGVLHFPPEPLLRGRDLVALGLSPSETFKTILDAAYAAQINLEFTTPAEACEWLNFYLEKG